ncbi:TolB family protein [Plantactinospora sp. WMMB334]|uniref:TolB family protein n=1 Tax=Plantactinospora sp. WMMB334 TaxID=3404119 RepID=UPI003B9337A1
MINTAVSLVMAAVVAGQPVVTGETPRVGHPTTSRVSVTDPGAQGVGPSSDGVISGDGRYVAFASAASNLVPGDTNGTTDVFVRDRVSATTSLVSVASDGTAGNAWSTLPVLSADGRFVLFNSRASNLVPGDVNDEPDAFLHDRRTGTTTIVNVSTEGVRADGESIGSSISPTGRFVSFLSWASNLVPGDTNGVGDTFVRDLWRGVTSRVSVSSLGAEGNHASGGGALSADGRYVVFESDASNLVPGDTNESPDVFVRDRWTGTTSRVSVTDDEREAIGPVAGLGSSGAAISADGRYVTFSSFGGNLVPGDVNDLPDVFVRDRRAGTTRMVSVSFAGTPADAASRQPSISADGRYVAFSSEATNLVPGDTNRDIDMFLHDRLTRRTIRVSTSSDGVEGNGSVVPGQVSGDGQHVVFSSYASNIVPGDSNEREDVFVWDRRGLWFTVGGTPGEGSGRAVAGGAR